MKFLPVRIPFFFGDREYQWRSISESAHVPFFRPLRAICFTADDFLQVLIKMDCRQML